MKELVCVAPDGSLEVWKFGEDGFRNVVWTHEAWDRWDKSVEERFLTFYPEHDPEFWGRIVLGKL